MRYTAYLKVPQLVISALGRPSASILDLGCGTGLSSLLFFEKGCQASISAGTTLPAPRTAARYRRCA
jgi:methylase of polypeptide subunit release factors